MSAHSSSFIKVLLSNSRFFFRKNQLINWHVFKLKQFVDYFWFSIFIKCSNGVLDYRITALRSISSASWVIMDKPISNWNWTWTTISYLIASLGCHFISWGNNANYVRRFPPLSSIWPCQIFQLIVTSLWLMLNQVIESLNITFWHLKACNRTPSIILFICCLVDKV